MNITAYDLATRYVGIRELKGDRDHPLIRWWLSLCDLPSEMHDETPWCSAFMNGMAWELRLPRSKSAAARSWLSVGEAVGLRDARVGYDVVVLKRGAGEQPGPAVIAAPGHVGLYGGMDASQVLLLAGNQGDQVCVAPFPATRVLGVRRLAKDQGGS